MAGGTMWSCSCGRRVPASVETCRCGLARPLEQSAAGAADFIQQRNAQKAAPTPAAPPAGGAGDGSSGGVYRGYVQIATVLLAVLVYFGSRAYNKSSASSEARAQLVEAFGPRFGAEAAERVADAHHASCFESSYQTGWGRRGGSKFDTEKYVACVLDAVRRDPSTVRSASSTATTTATTTTPPPPGTAAVPVQAVAPPASAYATVHGLQISTFIRETGLAEVQFVATGSDLAGLDCEYRLGCERGPGHQGTGRCLSGATAGDVPGSLSVLAGTSPGEGICSISIRLVGSAGPRSAWARATLVETAQ